MNLAIRGGSSRIKGLDGLRGISILLVLALHFSISQFGVAELHTTGLMFPIGTFGVQVFFLISGFLITRLLVDEEVRTGKISLRSFYYRRAYRILPPATLYLLTLAILQHFHIVHGVSIKDILSCFFFFRNYTDGYYLTDHFWSLSVEEQFYLVWPVLIVLLGKGTIRRSFTLLLITLLGFLGLKALPLPTGLPENCHYYASLLIGCGLIFLKEGKLKRILCSPLCFYTSVSIIILSFYLRWNFPLAYLGRSFLVGAAIIFLTDSRRESGWVDRVFNFPALVKIGKISYGLYLWQQLFWGWGALSYSLRSSFFGMDILLAFLPALLSYYLLELPLLRLRNHLA